MEDKSGGSWKRRPEFKSLGGQFLVALHKSLQNMSPSFLFCRTEEVTPSSLLGAPDRCRAREWPPVDLDKDNGYSLPCAL